LRQGMAMVNGIEGSVILLDPRSGEILAMVEAPTFDPLTNESICVEDLRISSVATQFEPGSTFKIVPVAAALENGVFAPDDTLHCGNGVRIVGRDRIRDHRKFGVATITEIISGSSNIGAGKIAERVGFTEVNRMAQALGFGHHTGIALPGEAKGYIPHPLRKGWSDRSLVTLAYGQEISCSSLQMALAYGAIANGGMLMKPQIIKATLDGAGEPVFRCQPEVVRQAMSRETAATVTEMLRQVVVDGTGTLAEVPGFPPAGKTGTAQVYDPVARRYDPDEHILSFVGFAPYDEAKVVCAVSIKCLEDLHASEVAVPVFANIMNDLICYFDTLPERSFSNMRQQVERISLPDVRGLDAEAARRVMHRYGLVPVFENRGERVAEMLPQARRVVRRGDIVTLKLDGGEAVETVSMPLLTGLSLRRAATLLAEADLVFAPNGSGWIVRQDPVAGAEVDRKTRVRVWASPEISKARCDASGRNDIACQTR
jgi:membrane peptidoglycan carboxypeptidase